MPNALPQVEGGCLAFLGRQQEYRTVFRSNLHYNGVTMVFQ
jgi:hypothetical protein